MNYSQRYAETSKHGILPADIGASSWDDIVKIKAWQKAHRLKADGEFGAKSVAAYRAEHPATTSAPAPVPLLHRIGAWTLRGGVLAGWASLKDRAINIGLTDVCLMINSSDDAHATPFTSAKAIAAVCDAYRAAGIAPWLATWARPNVAYMNRAADSIATIASLTQLAGIHVDAEEPWLAGSTGHREAAERFAERMASIGLPWWVTGIVHTDMTEEGQLVRLSSGGIVQAYSTRKAWIKWGVQPGTSQTRGYEKWLKFGVPVELGLAAYDQEGAGKLGTADAMTKALEAAAETGCGTAWYWALESLQGPAADVVRSACAKLPKS